MRALSYERGLLKERARQRERERERKSERERHTHRDTETEREIQRERERDRGGGREREREREGKRERSCVRPTRRQSYAKLLVFPWRACLLRLDFCITQLKAPGPDLGTESSVMNKVKMPPGQRRHFGDSELS